MKQMSRTSPTSPTSRMSRMSPTNLMNHRTSFPPVAQNIVS
jgi:hypothetical protein